MAKIIVNGQMHEARAGDSLLNACLSLGYDIPYFCWHPALGSVGACRQCAVKIFKDAEDTAGRVVMSCMERVVDGIRVSTDDPEARAFRAGVIEWLMTNHPHDCPVCDEGGECHLQDMTVMTGHVVRRFRFKKRTFRNQDLGPFINHELNRCIQCYRCTRFYSEYAGGTDFAVMGGHNHLYFGRHRDGALESEFSGNLVEVCPTGVFTDKTLKRHFTRKWDLTTAPSICVHCSLGCNTIPGERYGTLRRIRARYHGQVNGYFLCDRGRYGYEFVNGPGRVRRPRALAAGETHSEVISAEEAILRAAGFIGRGKSVAGIGSPRASLESNFMLKKLVGSDRFALGLSDQEAELTGLALDIIRRRPRPAAALKAAERSSAALVLGEDVTNTAPLLDLAIRQAALEKPRRAARALGIPDWQSDAVRTVIQDERGPLIVAAPWATKLDSIASAVHRLAPADIARLGFAAAQAIDPEIVGTIDFSPAEAAAGQAVAAALLASDHPLVVAGVSGGEPEILRAAESVVSALERKGCPAELCLIFPECDTLGLVLLGGRRLGDVVRLSEEKPLDCLVVLENDLFRRMGESEALGLLQRCREVVVIDHTETATAGRASLVLPAATFAESTGTLVNYEGRAQRFFRVMPALDDARESRDWVRAVALAAGQKGFDELGDYERLLAAMAEEVPGLSAVAQAAPGPGFRINGQKIPRQPLRASGRTAMNADREVSESKPPDDPDSPLSFTMEGYGGLPPPALIPFYWRPGWNSCQALNKFQEEIAGPLRGGDPGVLLVEPAGRPEAPPPKIPAAFRPEKDKLLLVPIHHIFGSEELSVSSPGIETLRPRPYLLMNERDAGERGWAVGRKVKLEQAGLTAVLPLRTTPDLPRGVAGVPAGLPELAGPAPRGWARVTEAES